MLLSEIPQKIDAKILATFIPHSGRMVLLDHVHEWSDDHIVCAAISHGDKSNPLRINDVISAIHTIEYAAQAASFHAALVSLKTQKPLDGMERYGAINLAFLAIVRDFQFMEESLDSSEHVLMVHAHRILTGARMLQYGMSATIGDKTVSKGQITLVIEN